MESKLFSDDLLELLQPLYGLSHADYYFPNRFVRHFEDDLLMRPTAGDLVLHTKPIQKGFT